MTDEQVKLLLDTVKGRPPYVFIMLGLYSGLRREEILALQWDCVFLDVPTPYISVQRAWRTEHNRPIISTVLKTKAAKRDVPIPKCLADCLREVKATSISKYVIADREGNPLSASQFQRVWQSGRPVFENRIGKDGGLFDGQLEVFGPPERRRVFDGRVPCV